MARLSFRCDEELVKRVDAARGDVARERWLRRTVERALVLCEIDRIDAERYEENPSESPAARQQLGPLPAAIPQPYRRQPGPDVRNIRSSQQARRDVKPFPKGKS
jgi:hypothetical protein